MSSTEVDEAPPSAKWFHQTSIKTAALALGLSACLIVVGFEAWDFVDMLNLTSVSAPDGGSGYGNSSSTGSGSRRVSPGYSTGPDDKNYLRLPGVPDYPGRR